MMFRVCIHKTTGRLIEMQSGGRIERAPREEFVTVAEYQKHLVDCDAREALLLDTLRKNAAASGYAEDEIEVKLVSAEEWGAIEAAENEANLDPNREVKARLAEIDRKSIRSMREWISKQPDAPQFIKDYEVAAIAERAKLTSVK